MKLKAELCTVRTSCKRHAQELVLAYYAELSSNIDIVLEWSQQNSALIPASAAGKKDRLIKLYRKAKIADLTGVENQERKAKFIYDLSKLVSCLQLFDDAAFDIFIILACRDIARRRQPSGAIQPSHLRTAYYQNCFHMQWCWSNRWPGRCLFSKTW